MIPKSHAAASAELDLDREFPGTAVSRLRAVHQRVKEIAPQLSDSWPEARRKLLWAGGLRDLPDARPGQGYTGHAFNDSNHCDLTCMLEQVHCHHNADGAVVGISRSNQLGPGIKVASLPELGPGGSWSTCTNGCHLEPPQDVAHVQFQARVAFKLVWLPPDFASFALLDDTGQTLCEASPTEPLPPLRERQENYRLVQGGRYDCRR